MSKFKGTVSNDLGFEHIFSTQLEYQGGKGDVFFGMTGSGNSKNIVNAFKVAKSKGMITVLMTRNPVTKSDEYADCIIRLCGVSNFPGQIGGNNNNFHYEDCISKVSHIAVGILKNRVNQKQKQIINPNKLRKIVLDMVYEKKSGHIGGSFSIAELVSILYSKYDFVSRDKFILSKGHAVPIIYAALYEIGLIDDKTLSLFREVDSLLQGHPDKLKLKYIHATTGSLGQGLSIAIGHSQGKALRGEDGKVFCVLGDGEMQEGQVWEGLMYYPKTKLNNMICFLDWNKYQSDNAVNEVISMYNNLDNILSDLGWYCEIIDGHSVEEIERVLNIKTDKPLFVILETVKGKGVSFMEGSSWHSKVPTETEYLNALKELEI